MRFLLFSFYAVSTFSLVLTAPQEQKAGSTSLNPPLTLVKYQPAGDFANDGSAMWTDHDDDAHLTNAQRMKRGLRPKAPKRFLEHSRRSQSLITSKEVTATGHILCKDSRNHTTLGFLSATHNDYGQYGQYQPTSQGALEVTFTYTPGDKNQLLDIKAKNPPNKDFVWMGGVKGYAAGSPSIDPGDFDYGYIVGTKRAPLNSPPIAGPNSYTAATTVPEPFESRDWKYNPVTQALSFQWTNEDHSKPKTFMVSAGGLLMYTGDFEAFERVFYDAGVSPTTCALVPTIV